ncbi:DegV family protein [Dermacoccus nishinomiyaensis]|uniref:DegV family protein n=1 Tax=Dermacoccus nishinomiyaensis TaxID=1274 RepID=UPI00289938F9|nr:DegV family protein [Dermacoccus nishinomiyaensis]
MARAGGRAGRVGVVTDSTACLPAELVAACAPDAASLLRVAPLNVTIGDVTRPEDELGADAVASAQAEGIAVTTSRPSPAAFVEAYRALADAGCTSIVSLHASQALSSTVSSARLASLEAGLDVEVVDSRTLGMALGFGVLAALRWSQAGYDVDAVAEAARATCASSRTAFYVDSLEPLRRGGRIGRAGALFGSALSIKPLLQVDDGVIAPLTRVRSRGKAVERLGTWALAQAENLGEGERVCAVHSLQHSELAQVLVDRLGGGASPGAGRDGEARSAEASSTGSSGGSGDDATGPAGPCSRAAGPRAGGAAGAAGPDAADQVGDVAALGASSPDGTRGDGARAAAEADAASSSAVRWAMAPVQARLGAVVTAHVGAGALGAVVAVMPEPPG